MKTIIYLSCLFCKKEFKARSPSEARIRKFCSSVCQHNADKKEKISIVCVQCGKVFEKIPSLSDAKCCSRSCKDLAHRLISDSSLRRCWVCGLIKNFQEFSGKDYRCRFCAKIAAKKRNRTSQGRFVFSVNLAKRRELEWAIDKVDYFSLISQKCHYCGDFLDVTGIGLDRKDNNLGYLIYNVVPCCGLCNVTRSDNFTYEEMLVLAESIKIIKTKRSNTLSKQILQKEGHTVEVKEEFNI